MPFELHPETPAEGARKPFPPEQWPAVRARLERLAQSVGLPIDPPDRNYNSRFALETGELIRAIGGDEASGAFHHNVSRAFFVKKADISQPHVILPIAESHGAPSADVAAAWEERRFRRAVDESIAAAQRAGVSGVPAMAWPNQLAVVGMRRPEDIVAALQTDFR
jgi:predicted DsbA family dithiol-disulfide isomerase